MKKIIAMLVCMLLLVGVLPMPSFALNTEDIVILYENDVHCVIEGYSKLTAMKKELQETYAHVGVVSGGDFIQGNSLGVISRGEYVVKVMNLVGYDAVALGNHEFDFRMERPEELIGMMNTKPICCNFQKVGEDEPYFKPYSMVEYGDVKIAYIGVTTPSTITSSAPAQFKDENGNFLYTFNPTTLYETVQKNIDAAEAGGADYVIALSHIGYAEYAVYGDLEDVEDLIRNTDGFDVVLDAHSHTVIEGMTVTDKGGNEVLLSSTGTKFEYIGKLTVSEGELKTELIKTEEYEKTDPVVDACIEQIYAEYEEQAGRKVAFSEVDLITQDAEGNRLVRRYETNLGDLCADTFRYAVDADIGYMNGGSIRADMLKGDITYTHLLNVLPFNNTVVLAEVTGQTIKDMMEMAMKIWPEENGSFPHVSGLTFSVNTSIPSSVQLNEFEEFIGVTGEYRVYDLKVYDRESGTYQPLDLTATYTLAASNFILLECGSGMKMLENAKILQNDGILDVEAMERYITEALDGVIGEEYREVKTNVTFTEGMPEVSEDADTDIATDPVTDTDADVPTDTDVPTGTDTDVPAKPVNSTVWVIFIAAGAVAVIVLLAFLIKKKGPAKG